MIFMQNKSVKAFYISLPLQGKLFYLMIILGFIISSLNTVVNLVLRLSAYVVLTTFLTAILCLIIMLFALKTKNYLRMAVITFSLLILFVYPSLWFFNDGSLGPTLSVYVFNTAIMPIILDKKKVFRFILLEFLSIFTLMYIEYNFPQLIIHYPDIITRFIDIFFGTCILIAFSYAMINGLMREYIERIKELHEVQKQLEMQSVTDELSGLFNRRYIMGHITQLLEDKKPFSLIMFDIDNFKGINDTYGHNIGDEVIIGVGHLVQHHLPKNCVVGRIGGEEYLIVLQDIDVDTSKKIADQLLRTISDYTWTINGLRVTVSGGFYTRLTDDSIIHLLKEVDLRLYDAKAKGKNRITYM